MNGCPFQHVLRQNLSCFFFLTQENAFSYRFMLNPTKNSVGSSKRDFQISFAFERSKCFYATSLEILNVFNAVTSKQIF